MVILKLALDTRYLSHVNIIVALFQGKTGAYPVTKIGTTQSVGRSVGPQGSRRPSLIP